MKLKIEVAQHERMASSGSSLLRSLQNENTPVLDLLVRESIQNSLDAALPETNAVGVDITIGSFTPKLLNYYFEGIGPELNTKYPQNTQKFLAIKDYNTVGLTGKLHYSEVDDQNFGNLQKLVYEISKPQTNEGAGGSWGLGKTVYFRVGIGLVIYYSRIIDENGNYASRLAATLVEDESRNDNLIQYPAGTKIKRGIAWWGKEYKPLSKFTLFSKPDQVSTCPITDQSEISNILNLFNIPAYSGTATGTTIIIPYIDEQKLLKGIAPTDDIASSHGNYYWLNNTEAYLRMAVQRWYTPRMSYKYEQGPYLKASINGKSLLADNLAPYYKILLQLYENTTKQKEKEFAVGCQKINGIDYFCQKVSTRGILSQSSAGFVSYAKVSEKDLHMCWPDNEPTPYAFAGKYDMSERTANPAMIAYIRKPGMVVSYETTGAWLDGVMPTTGDDYIIALFVLNSENEVKGYASKYLEEYIRKGERSDHTAWFDWPFSDKQTYIVSRIKSNTAKNLRSTFAALGDGPKTLTHSGLEKALADLLLPPDGFGHGSNGQDAHRDHGGDETSHSGKSPVMKVKETIYHDSSVEIKFSFVTGKGAKEIVADLQVLTDTGAISANSWEKDGTIGTAFPLKLTSFVLNPDGKKVTADDTFSNNFKITIENTERFSIPYGVTINYAGNDSLKMDGSLTFNRTGRDILGGISVNTKGGKEEK